MDNPNPILCKRTAESSSDVSDPLIIEIFDLIRDIKDPEHPHTLEELNVVSDEWISIQHSNTGTSSFSETCSETSNRDASNATPSTATHPQQDGTGLSDEESVVIRIEFRPTVPHCSLATLIGLCLRVKLERTLTMPYKLDILVGEGTHSIEDDVNKQINDKERVAAAMENPGLRDMVEQCIREVEY